MTKQELSEMLHATGCPVNEGISDLNNGKKFPRIDYWEIAWDDVMASGDNYEDKITWQVSFYSRTPRNEKLIMLRDMMRKRDYTQLSCMNLLQTIKFGIRISRWRQ